MPINVRPRQSRSPQFRSRQARQAPCNCSATISSPISACRLSTTATSSTTNSAAWKRRKSSGCASPWALHSMKESKRTNGRSNSTTSSPNSISRLEHADPLQLRHDPFPAQLLLSLHCHGRPAPYLQSRRRRCPALQMGRRHRQRLDQCPRHRRPHQRDQRQCQGVIPFLKVANDTAVAVNQCFAPETLIYTAEGVKPISEVASRRSRSRHQRNLSRSHRKICLQSKRSDGR